MRTEKLSPCARELRRVGGELALEVQRRVAGALGVVLVGDRRAEQGHDPVAGELVDRPLEAVDALAQDREEALHDPPPLLRVALLGELHRPHHVGEQHRHLLALPLERGAPTTDFSADRFTLRLARGLWRREVQGGVLPQDRLLELAQLSAGLDAELVDEHLAGRAVDLERLGLAAATVQAEHQLAAEPLAERELLDESLQLADELAVAAEREVGLDALLQRARVQLVQTGDLRLGPRLIGEVRQRRSAPQRKRLAQLPRRHLWVRAIGVGQQLLKSRNIQLGRIDKQHVARLARDESAVAELLAQPGDIDLDALGDRRWR